MLRKTRGQATLEYVLLLAGIVSFLVVFLGRSGEYFRHYDATYTQHANLMGVLTDRLESSYYSGGSSSGTGGSSGGGTPSSPSSGHPPVSIY